MKSLDADTVGILEAVGWSEVPAELDYPFSAVVKANSKYNLAATARFPIQIEAITKNIRHAALHAVPKGGPFADTHFFFVHLSPLLETDRLRELDITLPIASAFPHTAIMGDFNSLSPHDPYDRGGLLAALRAIDIKKFGERELAFDVIRRMESEGWIDAMRALKQPFAFSVPTPVNEDKYHVDALRLDYAFLSPGIASKLKDARIVRNEATDFASDHYPIVIDLAE